MFRNISGLFLTQSYRYDLKYSAQDILTTVMILWCIFVISELDSICPPSLYLKEKSSIWVWNNMRVRKRCQNFHFWVNYTFKP